MLAIRAVRLFDVMADQLHARPLVLVDQGRITEVDTTGADPPEGAALVDPGGATLLPGLIDSHTIWSWTPATTPSATSRNDGGAAG